MKKTLIIGTFIILTHTVFSQARKYSNEFLKIGVGGRNLGLGNSLVASENDPTSVYYNPAALATLESTHIGVMHNSYFAGIANFDYVGFATPFKENQTIGVSLIRLGIDNIPNTIDLYNPDGTINYNNIKSFSISDLALFLSFAKKIPTKEGLSIGGNAKIIRRSYGSFASAWGLGVDAGVQYQSDKFKLGFFAQDISTTFAAWSFSFTEREKEVFRATNNEIPESSQEITMPSFHFGGQYTFLLPKGKIAITPTAKLSAYTDKRNVLIAGPASIDASLGLESRFFNVAFLRFGINNFTKATNDLGEEFLSFMPSMGVGVQLGQFDIDYSFNNIANAGIGLYSHVFSGVYRFKPKVRRNNSVIMPSTPNIDPINPADDPDLSPGMKLSAPNPIQNEKK